MHKFVRNLITEWRKLKLPFSGQTFVVAVSGGADSISLLLALHDLLTRKKLDLRFVVAHFNHNLRGQESDADEAFVKRLTAELGFELAVGHGQPLHEGNVEQNARLARYAFLGQTAANLHACGVLTAHTMNDQAETFLMNLIRGSGVDGLSGMKTVRSFKFQVSGFRLEGNNLKPDNVKPETLLLVRPLLSWAKRLDTENFCRESEIEYRYDSRNEATAFKRVRIRKMLLPMLTDFNPNIIETLANTANLIGLLSEPTSKHPREQADEMLEALSLSEVKSLSKPDLYRTLRKWLGEKRGNLRSLELKHIEAIERLIFSRKSGRSVELPNGDTVVKQDGKLVFTNIKVDK